MTQLVISDVRVFDGEHVLTGRHDVVVSGGLVRGIEPVRGRAGTDVVEGSGATLLPGLIDAHVHADREALRQAAAFGVTTVLDMGGSTRAQVDALRDAAADDAGLADIRSCLTGLTPPDGHPHQLIGDLGEGTWPTAATVEQVPGFVADRVAEGADYLKAWIEDGRVLGHPVPPLRPDLLEALVVAAHGHGCRVVVHALTRDAAEMAVSAGADGLTHMFVDDAITSELVASIAAAGMHVVPTLGLLATLTGNAQAAALAEEPRARECLPATWRDSLRRTWSGQPRHLLAVALTGVRALHAAGVPILAGTDASRPDMPGLAHGVSLHAELRLLVEAGLSPTEALRAATSVPADRFGLLDRGRVELGRRADLVLVDGDPSMRIDDSMAIRAVWRAGSLSSGPAA